MMHDRHYHAEYYRQQYKVEIRPTTIFMQYYSRNTILL